MRRQIAALAAGITVAVASLATLRPVLPTLLDVVAVLGYVVIVAISLQVGDRLATTAEST